MISSKKNDHIDYLKALAAMLVVFHHAIEYSGLERRSDIWALIVMLVDSLHVPLFFSIAGYLCHKQDKGRYIKKKISRILFPFFTFSLLKLIYSTVISSRFSHASSLLMQFYDAFVLGRLYWFPYAIFLCYCLAMLFWTEKNAIISGAQRARLCIAFSILVIVNMLFGLEDVNCLSWFQIGNALSYFCFFLAGMIFRQFESRILPVYKKHSAAVSGVCIAIIAAVSWLLGKEHLPYGFRTRFILAFALIPLFCSMASKLPVGLTILNTVGKYSLQVMFFDSFYKIVLFGLLRQIVTYRPALVMICVVLNIACTCVSCLVIKRYPFYGECSDYRRRYPLPV